jgi:hypothetical protein
MMADSRKRDGRGCPATWRGCLRAILAKQQISGPRNSKCEKRGCQKEKQPVDIWIEHDDVIPPPTHRCHVAGASPAASC